MVTGNRNILNSIKGVTSVIRMAAAEKTALANHVLPANILIVDADGILYLTDGKTTISALNPLIAASNTYALDKSTVHRSGDETIAGAKSFTNDVEFTNVTEEYISGIFE